MTTLIKRVLYTGVGLVANTTEKVQKTVSNIVERDQAYQKEGKKVLGNLLQVSTVQKENLEERFRDRIEGVLDKMDLVSKRDYDELVKKINRLEKAQKAKVKTATKKTTSKKASTTTKAAPKTTRRKSAAKTTKTTTK